jgi:hypothetical protein
MNLRGEPDGGSGGMTEPSNTSAFALKVVRIQPNNQR